MQHNRGDWRREGPRTPLGAMLRIMPGILLGVLAAACSSSSGDGEEQAGPGGPGAAGVVPLDFGPFLWTGEPGGPFLPESFTFSLLNTSEGEADWEVSTTGAWLTGAATGRLDPGGTVDVVLGYDPAAANAYTIGSYSGAVTVRDLSNGIEHEEPATLLVLDPEGSLTIDPIGVVTFSGEPGGPFDPAEFVYTLANQGSASIDWTAASDQTWLSLSSATGSIAAGASAEVTVTLDAGADALAEGLYSATVSFANTTNGSGDTTRRVELVVASPSGEGTLVVAPAEDYFAAGPEGGPFTPSQKTYLLANAGGSSLDWGVAVSGGWLTVPGAVAGTLVAGQSTPVAVQVAPSADSLTPGVYGGTIAFSNTTSGAGNTSRNAGLSVTVNGWTDLQPSSDTRLVYVSSSTGNDANDGLSEATPKATISAGYELLRDGFPDWLQLRQGDGFSLFSGLTLHKSGRSAAEPQVITSYGSADARPTVYVRGHTAIGMSEVSNIAIAHIAFDPTDGVAAFRPDDSNPRGVVIFESCSDILLEGCLFTNFGIVVECGPVDPSLACSNIAIRRNVIDSTYGLGGGSGFGLLMGKTNGIVIEENFLDRCGNNDQDPRARPPSGGQHAIYLQSDCSGACVLRGNVITRPSSAGAQCRAGGIIEDNFVTRSAGALRIGGSGDSNSPSGWVQATVQRNVILEGWDYGSDQHIHTGMWIQNADGVTVRQNILANTAVSPFGNAKAIWLSPDDTFGNRAVALEENVIYDWGDLAVALTSHSDLDATGWRLVDNDIQNNLPPGHELLYAHSTHESSAIVESRGNRYWGMAPQSGWFKVDTDSYTVAQFNSLVGDTTSTATQVVYPDPTRDVGDYMTSLGTGSDLQDFIDAMLQQSKHDWREEYTAHALNDFLRAGFGVSD